MLVASASPNSVWVNPNKKEIIDAECEITELFNQAANLYASRGGFGEEGTQLNRIRQRRVK